MRAWVTDWNSDKRPVSIDYRFASSMQGSLSLGANLDNYTSDDMKKAAEYVALYKEIRNTVQFGDMYRLSVGDCGDYWATQYADENQSVLFAMSNAGSLDNKRYKRLKLKGLQSDKMYTYTLDSKRCENSGEYLMNAGITIEFCGPLQSKIIVFK